MATIFNSSTLKVLAFSNPSRPGQTKEFIQTDEH